ncbi:MAG: TMAO reductase system sensor histidine kinase/response regulator TorS [Gammaproteobacteria bacterium]
MRTLGIATKLFLAFGGIFALAFIAALVAWQGFQRIADTQNVVIDHAIPGLRHAHQLAETNALIGSASLSLTRASTEQQRQRVSTILFDHVKALRDLLDDFEAQGFAEEQLQTLRPTVEDIAANLRRQSELVRQRLQQQIRFEKLAAKLIATTGELNEVADSLVANAAATTTAITSNLYDLVEHDVGKQKLYDVFDRLVEVDIDGMERMYELRLRSSNLRALVNQVSRESDAERLGELRLRSVETLSILKRRVDEINDPQRKRQAHALLDAMELSDGPLYVYDIFHSKLALLDIKEKLQQLELDNDISSRRLDKIVGELTQAGGSLISSVSVAARESLYSSRVLFSRSAIISLLAAALILWVYIKRNVIRRLLSLESATRSIATGRYDVEIDTGGADELSRMAGALQVFRDNAIEKRKVDEELLEHKTHLEHLVSQRTAELEQANSRLADVAQQHAIARDKAEQANRAKTAFLATMSHELRTPLSGALGTLRLLEDTALSQQQLEYLRTIATANSTLLDILNDILGYSQIEAGKLRIENRQFALHTLLKDIVDLMSVSAREHGNRIVTEFDPELPSLLHGDAGKLHQILLNLIGNAIKFTDAGVITVRAEAGPDNGVGTRRLRFQVQDTGIGIPADRQQDIFRAFTQVDSSTARRQGGIGLGLAICERLVTALGGEILLTSAPRRGTMVEFSLEMCVPAAVARTEEEETSLARSTGPCHVLVVEDDPTNRMITDRYLEKLGHRISTAENGELALKALDTEPIDLVLLDIGLPGMDGLSILKRIRQHSSSAVRDMPVIAMSAHVFQEEVDHYMSAGMDGFLGKPFSLNELAMSIDRVSSGSTALVFKDAATGKLVLDRTVVVDDIRRLGVDQVQNMVDVFAKSGEEFVQEIARQAAQGDAKAVTGVAHKMRGAAGNFGLHKLCALLAEAETAGNEGETRAFERSAELRELFEESLAELEDVLHQHVEVSSGSVATGR